MTTTKETAAPKRATRGGRSKRRAVYKVMFGWSEPFLDTHYERDGKTDFICFTDDPNLRSDFWEMQILKPVAMDPARAAKRIKHNHWEFLPNHAQSLYIDNTVELLRPLDEIFGHLEGAPSPMVTFKHPFWDCIYTEAEILIGAKIDVAAVSAQVAYYRHLGHPEHAGMHAGPVILRDHASKRLAAVMREWDLQVHRFSFRDQLSLPVVARLMDFAIAHFPGELTDGETVQWPKHATARAERMPRNFDDVTYFVLNPQARDSGMTPREHYWKIGRFEGLKFRAG